MASATAQSSQQQTASGRALAVAAMMRVMRSRKRSSVLSSTPLTVTSTGQAGGVDVLNEGRLLHEMHAAVNLINGNNKVKRKNMYGYHGPSPARLVSIINSDAKLKTLAGASETAQGVKRRLVSHPAVSVDRTPKKARARSSFRRTKEERLALEAASPLGSFEVLPTEILLHLFSFLSGRALCQLRLTSSEFTRLGRDDGLWERICLRQFGHLPNRLAKSPYGKSWEWIYRSKAIVHTSKDAIKDGTVCCYSTRECKYEGEWKNGELEGYSIELWNDGEQYEGWSTDGRLNGYGRAFYATGDTYIGMWRNGLRAGGVYVWIDGWRYEGEYRDGKLTGHGTLIFKDGSRYKGDWLDGSRHGDGIMTYPDGSRYEGHWENDKRNGKGVLFWPPSQPSVSSDFLQSATRANLPALTASPREESPAFGPKELRYEGFWRNDQILEGGRVFWEDGSQLTLEESLKRL